MHQIVTILRNSANRYPRIGWLLANIVRRNAWLSTLLARRYGIRLPPAHTACEAPAGYRFPLVSTRDQLTERARGIMARL